MKKNTLPPIGIDNFAELILHRNDEDERYMFVDKSMLIKSFIGGAEKVAVITRPRRFGKTLNLSMLECFFNDQVLGEETKELFTNLAINKHPEVMKYQGKHKAIFLTFKGVKENVNYQGFYETICNKIGTLFEKHEDYIFSHGIKDDQKKRYREITNFEATETTYKNSLLFLSELLYKASGKKVYIFLDEYDAPIHDAYVEEYYEPCIKFMANLFGNTFKGNEYLEKAMITGILKVGKASLFSNLNNVKTYSMLHDNRYASYFGFTEEETNQLLKDAELPTQTKKLKEMYNGYEVGGVTLYNPWAIINFIAETKESTNEEEHIQHHWANTGGTHLLRDLLKSNLGAVRQGLEKLLLGGDIETFINDEIFFNHGMRSSAIDFWTLMLLAGYLKVVDKKKEGKRPMLYTLAFPNKEVAETFDMVAIEVAAQGKEHILTLENALYQLVEGNTAPFSDYITQSLGASASLRDTKNKDKEQFFHGFLLGLTSLLGDSHTIRSNRESGEGYYDIAIIPKDKNKYPIGILIELKTANSEKQNLQVLANQALSQIASKKYYQEMKTAKVPKILNLGLAFRHKDVALAKATI